MRRRFVILDVFAARRFAGNPLAVVLDAEGLDTANMQMIAREFNLAETVFVLPAREASHRALLRIFTPVAELPFAGHPTVGTAVLLNRIDGGPTRQFVVEEDIGPIHCVTHSIDTDLGRARFDLARLPEKAGMPASTEAIAAALGLRVDDIGLDAFKPSRWSGGVPMTFVPVRGLDAIARCQINLIDWDAAFGQDDRGVAYIFCRETIERGSAFHTRMFAPRLGVPEDPATGAAAAAFSGVYAHFEHPADGQHELLLEQGYEMGRPSLIELSLAVQDGLLRAAAIGGKAIVVSEGLIEA